MPAIPRGFGLRHRPRHAKEDSTAFQRLSSPHRDRPQTGAQSILIEIIVEEVVTLGRMTVIV
jgi:hypothetical protein